MVFLEIIGPPVDHQTAKKQYLSAKLIQFIIMAHYVITMCLSLSLDNHRRLADCDTQSVRTDKLIGHWSVGIVNEGTFHKRNHDFLTREPYLLIKKWQVWITIRIIIRTAECHGKWERTFLGVNQWNPMKLGEPRKAKGSPMQPSEIHPSNPAESPGEEEQSNLMVTGVQLLPLLDATHWAKSNCKKVWIDKTLFN